MKARTLFVVISVLMLSSFSYCLDLTDKTYTNSLGMKFTRIEPGEFMMGFEGGILSDKVASEEGQFPEGDFDEHPAHKVKITTHFYIGIIEVTNKQFELFDPEHKNRRGFSKDDDDAVVNVNWYDAAAFCQWLSDKEGIPYRLPTESEWEYACRAGTTEPFCMGQTLPEEFIKKNTKTGTTPPNSWGLYDMHGNAEEWCYDWYGPYEAGQQIDPVGRVDGNFKVTRGGSHSTNSYYMRSANRMGTLPEDKHNLIGFRVVIGPMPKTPALPRPEPERYQKNIIQNIPSDITNGPDKDKAYFYGPRGYIKLPPGNRGPIFNRHNHFISSTECPNGDLLAIWHSCITESDRELSVVGSRLRYGQDQWEQGSVFWDAPDRNDHGHALWYDGEGTIYHFHGLADISRNVALILRTSNDNGATWSKANIIADHGPSRMPIESVIKTKDGKIILICDKGPTALWISQDKGLSWFSPPGRVKGIHAPLVQLNDGGLLAFGRGGAIEGMMPMSISSDMGNTWEYSASEFQPVDLGQRSVMLRLKEGPIMFASFCKKMLIADKSGNQRPISGLFTAISSDEGKSWTNKKLVSDDGPGRWVNTMNGFPIRMDAYNSESAAYLTVCQSANGVINLLSSRQHYAFNYKWLITPSEAADPVKPSPRVTELPAKKELSNVFGPAELLKTDGEWSWNAADGTVKQNDNGQLDVNTGEKQEISCRSNGIDKIDMDKGFTFEFRVKVIKSSSDDRGIDVELYDGMAGRYALTIKEKGIYWYEGLVLGTTSLDFTQFTTVADGLDNTDQFHTFRIAVTSDRVAQIYRDGKLVGVRPSEYRTPRGQYLQFGTGKNVSGRIEYIGYDLEGPFQH